MSALYKLASHISGTVAALGFLPKHVWKEKELKHKKYYGKLYQYNCP